MGVEIPRFETKTEKKRKSNTPFAVMVIGLILIVSIVPKPKRKAPSVWNQAALMSIEGKVATFTSGGDTLILEIPKKAIETMIIDAEYTLTIIDGKVASVIPYK